MRRFDSVSLTTDLTFDVGSWKLKVECSMFVFSSFEAYSAVSSNLVLAIHQIRLSKYLYEPKIPAIPMTTRVSPRRRGSYGIDAPYAPAGIAVATVFVLVMAILSRRWQTFVPVTFMLAVLGFYLHSTFRGKFVVWAGSHGHQPRAEVAQIFNLLYRRFSIGGRFETSWTRGL